MKSPPRIGTIARRVHCLLSGNISSTCLVLAEVRLCMANPKSHYCRAGPFSLARRGILGRLWEGDAEKAPVPGSDGPAAIDSYPGLISARKALIARYGKPYGRDRRRAGPRQVVLHEFALIAPLSGTTGKRGCQKPCPPRYC